MNVKKQEVSLVNLIKEAQKDSNLELEVLLKSTIDSKLKKSEFDSIIRRIKGIPGIKLQSNNETLDIQISKTRDRYTIYGKTSINSYCKSNTLANLKSGTYSLMRKVNVNNVDISDYNIRVNLKRETQEPIDLTLLNNWHKLSKTFRYKKRFSYITRDKLFSFDLTVIKTSNKKIVTLPNQKKKKSEIADFMKKYVIKPDTVKDFDSWWSSLKKDSIVVLKGKKVEEYIPFKNIKQSKVLENPIEFEVELEYLGNKINYKADYKDILSKIIMNCGMILQSIQKSHFIISNSERNMIKQEYKTIMGVPRFSAPQNITLEMKHIIPMNYSDYSKVLSIRRNYSVTDKADGERNLLIVAKDDSVYLLNRKNEYKTFGCKLKGFAGTIMDGELILTDKENKNINLFAVFDIYFHKKEDLRQRILNRSIDEIKTNSIPKSRIEILTELFEDLKVIPDNPINSILIIRKKFYYGDIIDYNPDIDKEIIKVESELKLLDKDSESYTEKNNYLNSLKADTKIFSEASSVLGREQIYKTDGLVFTPINLVIGDEMDGKPPRFDGRWNKLFKWKPPEENTIDFRVQIKKDDSGDIIEYKEYNGKLIPYKTLLLNVGYDPKIHTKFNSCRVMNEELLYKEGYHDTPFIPHNPYVKNIEYAYIPVVNNTLFCNDKTIISDNMIIEFSYDSNKGEGFCWIPLRMRNNLTPNDYTTATNVWRTIHNPITKRMISTGIFEVNSNDEVYYFNKEDRFKIITKPMADFHSFVKKTLIKNVTKKGNTLIDLSCGRGGDINHWLDANLSKIVGIDLNRDNLENINNGACNRILNAQLENKSELLKNILLIWGDSSRLINTGDAAKDDLNKYYLDVLYENIPLELVNISKLKRFYGLGKRGFDVVSCQFSIHYFFENKVQLDILLTNVSNNLKEGGKFIGTCLDGKNVFNKLIGKTDISESYGDELLWKIVKKYDNDKEMTDDSESVGMLIDVFVNSIGKTTQEWLVNFDFLKKYALNYNLELLEVKPFEEIFKNDLKKTYGSSNKMSKELKEYSFLNSVFIFEKKTKT
jgi:hypothetical protein